MLPGRLDRRIVIQVNTPPQNGYGESVPAWTVLATVWAQVIPVSGREAVTGGAIIAEADTTFRIRWRDGILPTHRISYGSNLYDIRHIAEIGRREGIDIVAKMQAVAGTD